MVDHGHDAVFPIIWFIVDSGGNRIAETVQATLEAALADMNNRFKGKGYSLIDSGKRKPPNKCCNKCGDKPCS